MVTGYKTRLLPFISMYLMKFIRAQRLCDRLFTAISVLGAIFPITGITGSSTEVLFNTWGKFQSSRTNIALQSELHSGKG